MNRGRRTGTAPWLMSAEAWATVRSPTDPFFITLPTEISQKTDCRYNRGLHTSLSRRFLRGKEARNSDQPAAPERAPQESLRRLVIVQMRPVLQAPASRNRSSPAFASLPFHEGALSPMNSTRAGD